MKDIYLQSGNQIDFENAIVKYNHTIDSELIGFGFSLFSAKNETTTLENYQTDYENLSVYQKPAMQEYFVFNSSCSFFLYLWISELLILSSMNFCLLKKKNLMLKKWAAFTINIQTIVLLLNIVCEIVAQHFGSEAWA